MSVSTLTAEEVEPRQRLTKWLIGAASVVMLAGLLFGYDQGVIGSALDGIKKRFDIGTFAIEAPAPGTGIFVVGLLTVGFGVFIWFLLPETRGRTLAQIQQ